MLNWDDYDVAEGESQAATQQQTPVQPEVVNKALEALVEAPATTDVTATSQLQAAAAAVAGEPAAVCWVLRFSAACWRFLRPSIPAAMRSAGTVVEDGPGPVGASSWLADGWRLACG